MNRPSNQKYQLWPEMGLVFLVLFSAQTITLWHFTWSWGEVSAWGAFEDHLPYILAAIGYFIPLLNVDEWISYWEYLNRGGLQFTFLVHFFLPVALSAVTSTLFVYKTLWIRGGRENLVHVKGPTLLEGKNAYHHAKSRHRLDVKANRRSKSGISIHPEIKLCTSREQNNFAILGTTGAGKSMAFKPLVSQAILRGDSAIIYDEKGEYTTQFYDKKTTHLIAPWDRRSIHWNICQDVRSKQEANLIAKCLIPDTGEKDKVWIRGARLLFVGMLLTLIGRGKPWGWLELSKLLSTPQEQMLELLEIHFQLARTFIQKESKTTQGFYINLIGELNWIEDLAKAWPKPLRGGFSIKKWVNEKSSKKIIIIQSDPRFESIGAPLCNAIISLITRNYLALEEGGEYKTWLFIDEFANLPRNPMIKKWLELARSRGARSVLCTQSISQMREIYGSNDTDSILNLLSNVIALRVGAGGDDAKYISRIFGERIVERPNSSDPQSSWVRSKEPLVEDFEITQLKPASNKGVEGFLFIPGWQAAYRLVWPLFYSGSASKKHCPAAWLSEQNTKVSSKSNKSNRLNKRAVLC